MPLRNSVVRSLLGLPPAGNLAALLSSSSTCHPPLLQLSCSSSAVLLLQRCSSVLLGSCSFTFRASCTSAHTGSSSSASAPPALQEAGPKNSGPASTAAAGPAGLTSHNELPSSFLSSRRLATLPLFPCTATSLAWPAVQDRHVQSSRSPPPGTAAGSMQASADSLADSNRGGSNKGRDKRRWGDAAVGQQPSTPRVQRQQRWRPDVGSTAPAVSERGLTRMLQDCQTPQELLQLLHHHKLQQQGGIVNAIHVVTAFYSLGRMCQIGAAVADTAAVQQLLQHLDQLLPEVQQQLEARGLSNIIWACAHAKHSGHVRQLLSAVVQPEMLAAANSQGVANIVWAVGKLGHQVPQQQLAVLLAAFTAEGILGKATSQHIANVLLGMAYLGQQLPAAQLQLLLAALAAKSQKADPQHRLTRSLSNSLWAVAKLGQQVQDSKQMQQLIAAFVGKLSRATTQDVATTLWAVSEMGQQLTAQQIQPMLAVLVSQLHTTISQDVSNILLACARFRFVHVPLLAALEQQQHMQRFLAGAEPQHLANTASALAVLGHCSERLLGGLLQQAERLLQQDSSRFVSQELSNICWAVAVLDFPQYVPAVLQLAQAAGSNRTWGSAAPEGLRQLYQVHLWLRDSTPAAAKAAKHPGLLRVLSQQQLDECSRAWRDQVAHNAAATPSLLQQEVFRFLEVLSGWQVPPKQEERTQDKIFSIDIFAVTTAGVRLAVEVDGPSHFVSPGGRVNGPTQYRDRALKARGYIVVSIPWWEWGLLEGHQQKQDYLVNKLKAAGVNLIA